MALVVNEDSIQFINDEGETETLAFFEDSAAPAALSLAPDVECSQIVPVTAIQEVSKSRAYGEDSGAVGVKYVPQGNHNLCWAASMASILNYLKGTNYGAMSLASYLDAPDKGESITLCQYWYIHIFDVNAIYVNNKLSYDVVYNNAHSGKPIQAHVEGWDAQHERYGHAVVVRGCYISNSVVYYRIMDPNYGFVSVQMNSDGTFNIAGPGCTMTQYAYLRF